MAASDVVVVIGSGGMGRAIARRVGGGRTVVLADVDQDLLDATADELVRDGHRVVRSTVDVSSHGAVAELARLAAASGRVSNVVHTAGLSPEQASAEKILAVDLAGVAITLEEFGRVIEPGGSGVVIASMAAHMYPPFEPDVERQLATAPADELLRLEACSPERITSSQLAYPFAKRANLIRVAAAATSWGQRGARINSISPGVISTAMGRGELAGGSGQFMLQMVEASGTGRIGTPDDIAAAAEFLLGPSASFVTGIDLLVDGGVIAAMRTGGLS
ncbi:SDR family oxidoreductase [Mycobacterium sp.]|uniref:SDR family oxidoreductase n=1 Tax=Mycobacterium sp. TaxID=1785 RepID=UPI002B7C13BA|nr:SDR family oxidoreductase [Mycobacterium sp.]HME47597.1 SDR family oxidoreductase [Mycobacterium sp.]